MRMALGMPARAVFGLAMHISSTAGGRVGTYSDRSAGAHADPDTYPAYV